MTDVVVHLLLDRIQSKTDWSTLGLTDPPLDWLIHPWTDWSTLGMTAPHLDWLLHTWTNWSTLWRTDYWATLGMIYPPNLELSDSSHCTLTHNQYHLFRNLQINSHTDLVTFLINLIIAIALKTFITSTYSNNIHYQYSLIRLIIGPTPCQALYLK